METFSALLAICVGNLPVPGEFPAQRPVMRSFGVFFDLRLNKRLNKQSWGWWFETLSRPLWHHYNGRFRPGQIYSFLHISCLISILYHLRILSIFNRISLRGMHGISLVIWYMFRNWFHPRLNLYSPTHMLPYESMTVMLVGLNTKDNTIRLEFPWIKQSKIC